LFENLDFLDAADGVRSVLDVGNYSPDRRYRSVDGYLCFNDHGVTRTVGMMVYGSCAIQGVDLGDLAA
jgi:hypothetical protein